MKQYIKLFWPEIMYKSFEYTSPYSKTGIDFIDNDFYLGLKFE